MLPCMCQSLMDVDHTATRCGWYGWSQGAANSPYLVYQCGCGDHTIYVSCTAEDPLYYEKRCAFIEACHTS